TIKVSLNGTELAGITTDVKLIGDKNNPDSTKSALTALPAVFPFSTALYEPCGASGLAVIVVLANAVLNSTVCP
ncbi:hypothetical protein Q4R04_18765, partial [Morganella morganii]